MFQALGRKLKSDRHGPILRKQQPVGRYTNQYILLQTEVLGETLSARREVIHKECSSKSSPREGHYHRGLMNVNTQEMGSVCVHARMCVCVCVKGAEENL